MNDQTRALSIAVDRMMADAHIELLLESVTDERNTMTTDRYTIIIEPCESPPYIAYAKELPTVFGGGDTRAEAILDVEVTIGFAIEVMRERGEPIPQPEADKEDTQ